MQREEMLAQLRSGDARFDVVVVGGGITGAGVAREASGSGLKTLLVEQQDFAWGTSGRSSKMVHGGLRYLGSGHPGLTRTALRERNRLLHEAPGLVEPLPFLMPHRQGAFPGPRLFRLLLWFYDHMAGTPSYRHLARHELPLWAPELRQPDLTGGSLFQDAVTDDARLVLRLLQEARQDGALCLNYVRALSLVREAGRVSGLQLQDNLSQETFTVRTPLVINATGAWVAGLQRQTGSAAPMHIRPLRGSHLVLPWSRLPVTCALLLLHPEDRRPVFAFPWAGTTVLGTTDCDHPQSLSREPAITTEEVRYLLNIAAGLFPDARIGARDVISTWAGVRPVVSDGAQAQPLRRKPWGQTRGGCRTGQHCRGQTHHFPPHGPAGPGSGTGKPEQHPPAPGTAAGVPPPRPPDAPCGPVPAGLATAVRILRGQGRGTAGRGRAGNRSRHSGILESAALGLSP